MTSRANQHASFVLTDAASHTWLETFATSSEKLGLAGPGWVVSKQTLRGGDETVST